MKGWTIIALGLALMGVFFSVLIWGGFFDFEARQARLVGESVGVSLDRNWYEMNDTIRVTFTNNLSESVFLDGCQTFSIEGRPVIGGKIMKDWAVVWMQKCDAERVAKKIRPYSQNVFAMPAFAFDGELRIAVEYYLGCGEGKAIPYAKCSNTSAIRSGIFYIA